MTPVRCLECHGLDPEKAECVECMGTGEDIDDARWQELHGEFMEQLQSAIERGEITP